MHSLLHAELARVAQVDRIADARVTRHHAPSTAGRVDRMPVARRLRLRLAR
jgi:hypothetical protein